MAKPEQVLLIEPPQELTFIGKCRVRLSLTRHVLVTTAGPFSSAVSSVMKLSNPSDRRVAFKIKTTAPKRYCVKPNSGLVEPAQTVQISGERPSQTGLR